MTVTTPDASRLGTIMQEPELIEITESKTLGRWVLATVLQGCKVLYELTFAPDITGEEWHEATQSLPEGHRVITLEAIRGNLIGRDGPAMMATIT